MSDRGSPTANFASLAFSNTGTEICIGLTNGKIEFHECLESSLTGKLTFRYTGQDITLERGDYAFTMSYSRDDEKLSCGTEKRMLVVYSLCTIRGWEVRNKYQFSDFVSFCVYKMRL